MSLTGRFLMHLNLLIRLLAAGILVLLSLILEGCLHTQDVLTEHNNEARTGAYLVETTLAPDSVRDPSFGFLYRRHVCGNIYAQPLYAESVSTANFGKKNLLFIVTAENWVYAFDTDNLSPDAGACFLGSDPPGLVWKSQLEPTGTVDICQETMPNVVGITGTPVIDRDTNTMYVDARNNADGQYYLHAIDITTGKDRVPNGRQIIDGHIQYGHAVFNPHCQRDRPGLLLQNGVVYIAFGTFNCDHNCSEEEPYRGWVIAYRASDLTQVGVFCTSPDVDPPIGGAGVWQSGGGLVGDGSNIYFETGNGSGPYGDSFLKLRVIDQPPFLGASRLFHPTNADVLNGGDTDLGSGGPVLARGRLLGGGKQGRYYVLDPSNLELTQDNPGDNGFQGFQAFFNTWHDPHDFSQRCPPRPDIAPGPAVARPGDLCFVNVSDYQFNELNGPNIHSTPVYWDLADADYGLIYQMAEKDYMKAFKLHKSSIGDVHVDETPFLTSNTTGGSFMRPPDGMPGGASSLSANFGTGGIVWTSRPLGDAQYNNQPGQLLAFDATSLDLLWKSQDIFFFAKFTPPTVAAGRVYLATYTGEVRVYGVRPLGGGATQSPPSSPAAAIDELYRQYGRENGFLGKPEGEPKLLVDTTGGWYQDYQGQVIAPSPASFSVNPVPGPMPTCSRGFTGSPTPINSSIYWSPTTGAHVVSGDIRTYWLKLGAQRSLLGYPVADETISPDERGRVSRFEHGEILWYADKGASIRAERSTR
jgi:hypothetical protein